jgi:hypothetical protein
MAEYTNPLQAVNGKAIKCPSSYKFLLQDVSASDAGRTEDTVMDKKKIGQCVKLECEWKYITVAECAAILQTVDSEYMNVTFLSLKSGNFETSEFYVGDREAPMYNAKLGLVESLSFDFIERSGL